MWLAQIRKGPDEMTLTRPSPRTAISLFFYLTYPPSFINPLSPSVPHFLHPHHSPSSSPPTSLRPDLPPPTRTPSLAAFLPHPHLSHEREACVCGGGGEAQGRRHNRNHSFLWIPFNRLSNHILTMTRAVSGTT